MISKELFIEVINQIQENLKREQRFEEAIAEYGNCLVPVFDHENLDITLLQIIMNDTKNDWIPWWLFEDVEKIIYKDEQKIDLTKVEDLYDFLIMEDK